MNTLASRWIGIGALALALPLAAQAQQAFTRATANLRAGPSSDYPVVARLGPGQPLDVVGCTSGYGWCDVVLPDGGRGWVGSRNLDYAYQDQRVPLATYGAVIGVPIVGFAIGSYWANYYRDRPWYGDRRWWGNRPPPPVAGWRPPPPVRPGWPGWQPHPWQPGPGFRPPGPGFRPPPGPGFRPPPGPGFRPPRPQPGFRPGPPPGMPHPGGGGRPHGGGPGGGGHGGGHGGGNGGGGHGGGGHGGHGR